MGGKKNHWTVPIDTVPMDTVQVHTSEMSARRASAFSTMTQLSAEQQLRIYDRARQTRCMRIRSLLTAALNYRTLLCSLPDGEIIDIVVFGARAPAPVRMAKQLVLVCAASMMRMLVHGGKILALLRRNVRERKTRSAIIALQMQRVLGQHGPAYLRQVLPWLAGASTTPREIFDGENAEGWQQLPSCCCCQWCSI